jgi:predicted RNA-binding protein Jag
MSGMEKIQMIIESILIHMGISWKHISIKKGFFEREIVFNISGGTARSINKNKNGEGLVALNSLVHAIAEKYTDIDKNFSLDIEGARENFISSLIQEVEQIVVQSQEINSIELRSMSPFERKIIHDYIQREKKEYSTQSKGEGTERKIILTKNI